MPKLRKFTAKDTSNKTLKTIDQANAKSDSQLTIALSELNNIDPTKAKQRSAVYALFDNIIEGEEVSLALALKNQFTTNYYFYYYNKLVTCYLSKLKLIQMEYLHSDQHSKMMDDEMICVRKIVAYLTDYSTKSTSSAFKDEYDRECDRLLDNPDLLEQYELNSPENCGKEINTFKMDLKNIKERMADVKAKKMFTEEKPTEISSSQHRILETLQSTGKKRKADNEEPEIKATQKREKKAASSRSTSKKSSTKVVVSEDLVFQSYQQDLDIPMLETKQSSHSIFAALTPKSDLQVLVETIKAGENLTKIQLDYLPKALREIRKKIGENMNFSNRAEYKAFFNSSHSNKLMTIKEKCKGDFQKIDICRDLMSDHHLLKFTFNDLTFKKWEDNLNNESSPLMIVR